MAHTSRQSLWAQKPTDIRTPCQSTLEKYCTKMPFIYIARISGTPFSFVPQPSPVLSPWGAVVCSQMSSQSTCRRPDH